MEDGFLGSTLIKWLSIQSPAVHHGLGAVCGLLIFMAIVILTYEQNPEFEGFLDFGSILLIIMGGLLGYVFWPLTIYLVLVSVGALAILLFVGLFGVVPILVFLVFLTELFGQRQNRLEGQKPKGG